MKNIFKKLFTLGFLAVLSIFFVSTKTFAQTGETPFGGMRIMTWGPGICTCSGNSHWIMDYKSNSLIKLYYSPGQSKVYLNNNIDYSTFQVGTYQRGGAPACEIRVYKVCVRFNNDGTYGMMPGTGTSMNNPVINKKNFLTFLSPKFLSNSFNQAVSYLKLTSATTKAL